MKRQRLSVWFFFTVLVLCGCAARKSSESPFGAGMTLVDLTHTLEAGVPVYPGGAGFELIPHVSMKDGYYMNKFTSGEHTGTHVDAPAHFVAGTATVDKLAVSEFVGPAVVVDVKAEAARNPDYLLTVAGILDWERQHGAMPDGAIVVMKTGWWKRWREPKKYLNADAQGVLHFPGFSVESVRFLLEKRKVKGIGIDTLSTDYGPSKDFAEHKAFLAAGKFQIENLANLDALPPRGAWLIAAPLKIRDGSGAPARVMALVPAKGRP